MASGCRVRFRVISAAHGDGRLFGREGRMLESMRRFKTALFRTLSHPIRVAIVEYLQYGEMTIERLCEKTGVEQAKLS